MNFIRDNDGGCTAVLQNGWDVSLIREGLNVCVIEVLGIDDDLKFYKVFFADSIEDAEQVGAELVIEWMKDEGYPSIDDREQFR